MTHFRFVLNQRSIPLKSQFSLDFRWVFPWSSWRCCNPHQKRLPEAAKKAAERKAAKVHMLWYWRGAIVRYPTGIPLYNYQEWCSCRVSKVGHDPLFFGGVFTNLTLLSCVSVKFVSTCQVSSIWQRVFRNDTLRFGKGCLLRLPVVDFSAPVRL